MARFYVTHELVSIAAQCLANCNCFSLV
jgi:hypothetical protein